MKYVCPLDHRIAGDKILKAKKVGENINLTKSQTGVLHYLTKSQTGVLHYLNITNEMIMYNLG